MILVQSKAHNTFKVAHASELFAVDVDGVSEEREEDGVSKDMSKSNRFTTQLSKRSRTQRVSPFGSLNSGKQVILMLMGLSKDM